MKWIKAHKLLTMIICVAVLLSLTVTLSYLSKGNTTPIGRGVQTVTAAIQKPLTVVAHGIENSLIGLFRFKEVVAENEALKEENARLREEIGKITLTAKDLQELRELSNLFDYERLEYDYDAIAANVIRWDGANWFNIFTIDKGRESGVEKNDVVVNGDGLVGTVMESGDQWAKVISIIDETDRVSFRVFRDMNLLGIMEGDGDGGLTGFMLDNQAGVVEGDTLVTSNIGMYPEGIPIGKVTSVKFNTDTQIKTVTIEPGVNFKNLQKVAVIR